MIKHIAFSAGVALVLLAPAPAQETEVDPVLVEQGQQLYERDCAVCHQTGGAGTPPTFPALGGNDNLGDLELIVRNINQGQGAMPAFPNLTAEEIAAIATYIRNSWGNTFGGVSGDEVSAVIEALAGEAGAQENGAGATGEQVSVWNGVYTEEQAERGETAYPSPCGSCHGRRLNGAPDDPDRQSTPALARAPFLRNWDGRTLAALFEFTRTTMPQANPGSLSDEQYIDIIAYMLSVSGMPAGEEELPPDPQALESIVIEQEE